MPNTTSVLKNALRAGWASRPTSANKFRKQLASNLAGCAWTPHDQYSVFTQYDGSFYRARRDEFLHKYRCFWAVSKTIGPRSIIELGTHAGSSADAYLSATPTASYVGVDKFCVDQDIPHEADGSRWQPLEVVKKLFAARGFGDYELVVKNLRELQDLARQADLVVVDAAHDPFNEYEDLRLALTARPSYIFVDDAAPNQEGRSAIEKFLADDLKGRIEFTVPVDYLGGGLVIKLKS